MYRSNYPHRDELFESLPIEEQYEYFDWVETLQLTGYLSLELNDDEFMNICYRMARCDHRYKFNPN